MKKMFEMIFGGFIIVTGLIFIAYMCRDEIKLFTVIVGLLWCGMGAFIAFFDPYKFLELKTARIHEMTTEGFIHTKEKTTHINTYQHSINSSQEYTIRIKTPVGFYDAHGKDAYMTYREGDKVKILVRTRYNKKDKPFMQETRILGLLAQGSN